MGSHFNFEGRNLPLSKTATLSQAVSWVAKSIPPTPHEYSAFTAEIEISDKDTKEAQLKLYHALLEGKIKAKGYECFQHSETVKDFIRKPDVKLREIPKDHWSFNAHQWNDNGFAYYRFERQASGYWGMDYVTTWDGILINTADLMQVFPFEIDEAEDKMLGTTQLHKAMCRAVAKTIWHLHPTMTIKAVIEHHAIQEFGEGKRYKGKNTLRDWISEFDPRPQEKKSGPRK